MKLVAAPVNRPVSAGDVNPQKPDEVVGAGEPAAAGGGPPQAPTVSTTVLALRVQGGLSKVVAPATAMTLRATEPAVGKHGLIARMPRIVQWAAAIAVASAIGFVVTAGVIVQNADETAGPAVKHNAPGTAKPALPSSGEAGQ